MLAWAVILLARIAQEILKPEVIELYWACTLGLLCALWLLVVLPTPTDGATMTAEETRRYRRAFRG